MSTSWHRLPQASAAAAFKPPIAGLFDVRVACLFCIAAGLVLRVTIGIGQPLWLDEVWTGAIVDQPDFRHLLHSDSNAPAYFILMYGWTKLFGFSEIALRFPSLVFGIAAPLLIAFYRVPGLSNEARLTWAALLALWLPGIWYSQEARCYTLLLFLCTGQTLAFASMLARPCVKSASVWAMWSCLALLTHYHAVFITFAEAIAYLAIWRMHALRTWKAALIFTPAAAGVYHLPRLLQFTKAGLAWYDPLRWQDVPAILEFLLGPPLVCSALAGLGFFALVRRGEPERDAGLSIWHTVFLCACAAAALAVCLGFFKAVPGIALGFLLLCEPVKSRFPACYHIVLAACFAGSILAPTPLNAVRVYGFEAAARDLVRTDATHLVFAWDNPTSAGIDPAQLASLPAFVFKRLGHPLTVTPIVLTGDDEPNATLLHAAASPGSAILWMYDLNIHDTAARRDPPRIDRIDPSWQCRNYGKINFGVVACTRSASTAAADTLAGPAFHS